MPNYFPMLGYTATQERPQLLFTDKPEDNQEKVVQLFAKNRQPNIVLDADSFVPFLAKGASAVVLHQLTDQEKIRIETDLAPKIQKARPYVIDR